MMGKSDYRVWFPVSILGHLLLLAALGFVYLPEAKKTDTPFEVTFIRHAEATPVVRVPVPEPVKVVKPTPPVVEKRPVVVNPGDPKSHKKTGPTKPADPNNNGSGGKDKAGSGDGKAKPATQVLTSKTGNPVVPKGVVGGDPNGTGSTPGVGTGESGPTRGPEARHGAGGGKSKAAANIPGVNRVVFRVTVGTDGSVDNVRLTSSDNDDLTAIARGKVMGISFNSAMVKGKAVVDDVTVIVTFNNGQYSINIVR